MTTFIDGPAKGQTLMLRRSPIFLRVTEFEGKFDALDQPSDQLLPEEKAFAYVLTEKPTMMHLNAGKRSGWYPIARYSFWPTPDQPSQAIMSINRAWGAWCAKQPLPAWAKSEIVGGITT